MEMIMKVMLEVEVEVMGSDMVIRVKVVVVEREV